MRLRHSEESAPEIPSDVQAAVDAGNVEEVTKLLAQGLASAGDTQMPKIVIQPALRELLQEGGCLDQLFPRDQVGSLVVCFFL